MLRVKESAFSPKMLRNEFSDQTNPINYENKSDEQLEQKVCIMDLCIPKLEPCYFHTSNNRLNEDTLSTVSNEMLTSPIPFIIPYKVKDPIVLLERCDKIWETLQLIKNAQDKRNTNSFNEAPLEKTNSYIEYQPVLSNDNAALPNFEFSVKTKKKLFQCATCGKLYTKHSSLRYHAERIHRIYLTPLRNRYSSLYTTSIDKEKRKEREKRRGKEKDKDKEAEREVKVAEKEKNDFDQFCSKKNENKVAHGSLQVPSSFLTENDTFNHNRLKTRTNVLLQSSNSINDFEASKKKQDKRLSSKDLRQIEKQILENRGEAMLTCSLCKQKVKDIKKHLTDYHKIESSDFMLKQLGKTSAASEFKELDNMDVTDKSSSEGGTIQKDSNIQGKLKRKSSVSPADSNKKRKNNSREALKTRNLWKQGTRQCEVCFGIYKRHSFYRHQRRHRIRGETKENIHLFRCKYLNSPLCFKQREESRFNDLSSKNTNNSKQKDKQSPSSSKKKEPEGNSKKTKEGCNTNSDDNCEAQCSCGKLFQNYNALCMHKRSCNLKNNKISTTEDCSNESSSHDRDSNNGISITIKKKNNSYEIVDKDNGSEDKLQDGSHSKNSRVLSDISQSNVRVRSSGQQQDDLESSKYSKYHSILKIQTVDEDVDIDIEDELQTKSCNNNINQMNELLKDCCEEEENQKVNTVQNQEVKSKPTHENVLQSKQRNTDKSNIVKKYKICICGSKFYNKKAFDVHVEKHRTNSELMCGYCKGDFTDISTWNEHQCPTEGGKSFIDLPIQIDCFDCSVTFNMFKLFDEHIRAKHFDRALPFRCFECYKRFSNPTTRKIHLNEQHGETVCSICQKTLRSRDKSKHEAYHYGLGFPCHLCKKAYIKKKGLTKHKTHLHYKSEFHIPDYNKSLFANSEIDPLNGQNKPCKKSLKDLNKDIELES